MKLKKLTSVLLALIMLTQLLPLSVFSDDSEELLEYTVTEEYTYTSDDDTDNDDLLDSYVEQLFGISDNDGIMLTATYTGEDAFANDSLNLGIYNDVKSAIADIADGTTSSTVISLSLDTYYYATTLDEAKEALYADVDFSLIIGYLIKDCPYEMYWFGNTYSYGYSYVYYTNSSEEIVAYEIRSIRFVFNVASGYQDSSAETPAYTVDTSKVTAAKAAVANAKAIVDKYADVTDPLELLTAYKDEICDLVTYESAYSSYSYGDVWQLVYVFDGDEDTNVVCEGYSKAFQYLCDLSASTSGFECLTVTGYMSGGTGGGDHMWNVLYLDGVNYLVDVTNSDSGSIGQNGGLFMVTADTATTISTYGYTFTVSGTEISYTYDTDTLALYGSTDSLYNEYLALGEVSSSSGTTTVVPVLYGKALTLDGKIGVSYYFSMEGVENPEDYYLMAAVDGGTATKCELNDTEEINGVTYYYYTMYVGVADINSTITAYLTDGTNTVTVDDYSVADYCDTAITDTRDEQALCEALLTYGYYAEIYKDASSSITDYDDMTNYDVSAIDSTKYGGTTTAGVAKALTLYDEICIKLYLTSDVVSNSATFTVDGETYTPVADTSVDGYSYSIEIPVPAKDMDRIYTIYNADGSTLTTYSVYTYIMNNTSSTTTTNLANLCRAIYNYSVAAENYTGWH